MVHQCERSSGSMLACATRITSFIFVQSSDHARVELCPVDPLHPSLIVSPLSSHRTEYFSSFIPGTFCRIPWTLVRESSHIIRRQHYHWHFGRLFDAPNSLKHSMVKAYNGLNGITRPHGIDVTRLFGSPQIRRLSAHQHASTYLQAALHWASHKRYGKGCLLNQKRATLQEQSGLERCLETSRELFFSKFLAWGFQSGKYALDELVEGTMTVKVVLQVAFGVLGPLNSWTKLHQEHLQT